MNINYILFYICLILNSCLNINAACEKVCVQYKNVCKNIPNKKYKNSQSTYLDDLVDFKHSILKDIMY